MRKLLLIAGVAALVIPSVAAAQPGCRAQQHNSRVAGTVIGAGAGALLGGAISGHAGGAVLGAIGGGAIGNVAGGAAVNCDYAQTGYYDDNGVWHPAQGYYDSNGAWVEGAPPPPVAGQYGAEAAYVGAPGDVFGRESWLESRIDRAESTGAISHYDADRDRSRLDGIRDLQGRFQADHDGLTPSDRSDLSARLDDLAASVNAQWRPAY